MSVMDQAAFERALQAAFKYPSGQVIYPAPQRQDMVCT